MPPVFGTFKAQLGGTSCIWISDTVSCGDGTTAKWTLTISGTAPGQVSVTVAWSDGRVLNYLNNTTWKCLCPNLVTRTFYDTGNVNACNPKKTLCIVPVPPCCGVRPTPLPRTLMGQITLVAGTCSCFSGVATGPLNWVPADYKWEGTISMGACGPVTIKIGCARANPITSDITDWNGTIQFGPSPAVPQDISLNLQPGLSCYPVYVPTLWPMTGGLCPGPFPWEVSVDVIEM